MIYKDIGKVIFVILICIANQVTDIKMLAVSGDEMMTDSFPSTVVDDVVLKVGTRMVVKDALNVNIGGNPTAEGGEEDEGVDDQAVKVNDVVDAFRLQSMGSFDKKGLLAWLKGYLKAIKEHLDKTNPTRTAVFQEKSSKWCKEVLLKNPTDFELFTGPSFNSDGALAMMTYEGPCPAPTLPLCHSASCIANGAYFRSAQRGSCSACCVLRFDEAPAPA